MNQMSGGLGELPLASGPADENIREMNALWSTYDEIETQLQGLGIMPLAAPLIAMPTITPDVLRGYNDEQYMEVYNAHDAWNSYICETISQVQNIILQIENEIDDLATFVEDNIKKAGRGDTKKPTADEIKFCIKSHPRVRYLKLELQKNKQLESRLEARQKTLARAEKLLSRNIELIKAKRESNGQGSGMQQRASAGLPPRFR